MNVYLEVAKKSFKQRYAYRSNTYMFILTSVFQLFIQISIWSALYGKSGSVDGISLVDMINFIIITTVMDSLVRSRIADRLAMKIQDGSIGGDFLKPITLKYYLMMEQVGENVFYTLFTTLPVCLVASIFLGFRLPDSIVTIGLFFISSVLGIILILYINYILGLLAFWFKTSFYVRWFLSAFFLVFGGNMVPLWFYPDLLYRISLILPFRLVSFEPIQIYLGKLSTQEAINIILLQGVWLLGLFMMEKIIWNKAQEIVTVQGG